MERLRAIFKPIANAVSQIRKGIDPTHRRLLNLEGQLDETAQRTGLLERRMTSLERRKGHHFETEELLDKEAVSLLRSLLETTVAVQDSRRKPQSEDKV